jgi:predicted molibdopterin-dependent oxidoreductase YjgC
MIRLIRSQQDQIGRSADVPFTYDGVGMTGYEGETLTAALLRGGIRKLSSPARGMFCCMGLCQECTVLIEGRSVEACRVAVRKGLSVRSVDRGT